MVLRKNEYYEMSSRKLLSPLLYVPFYPLYVFLLEFLPGLTIRHTILGGMITNI